MISLVCGEWIMIMMIVMIVIMMMIMIKLDIADIHGF